MPTKEEWQELEDRCTWTWTTQGGKSGYRVTGTNGRSLFLPAAGYFGGISLRYAGSGGNYWSSSLSTGYPDGAYGFYFNSGSGYIYDYYRYYGHPVRPVCPAR